MFEHVIIGQYLPGQSVLHRMDARAKLLCLFFLLIIIFMTNDWIGYGSVWVGTLIMFFLSGVSFRYMRKGMIPILILIAFTFLLHAFFTKEGTILLSLGAFSVYSGGLQEGTFIAMRLLLLVWMTSLFTLTTSPIDLTDALEQIFRPLERFGISPHEIAFMMSIAIRFIPTLLQETEKVLKAQVARGADFTKGSLKDRSQAFISLLVPLFVRSFRRAEELAYAMEARGYHGGVGRTKLRKLTWRRRDTAACLVVFCFGMICMFLRQ